MHEAAGQRSLQMGMDHVHVRLSVCPLQEKGSAAMNAGSFNSNAACPQQPIFPAACPSAKATRMTRGSLGQPCLAACADDGSQHLRGSLPADNYAVGSPRSSLSSPAPQGDPSRGPHMQSSPEPVIGFVRVRSHLLAGRHMSSGMIT